MEFREAERPEGLQIEIDHPDLTADHAALKKLIGEVVADHGARIEYLAVVLTDRQTVHDLNREHLDHDHPTDVLSFPLSEPASDATVVDGEVYVDLDMAAERAPEFDTDFDSEVARYVVHGLLHLLGHRDATRAERDEMRHLEDRYLDDFGHAG